MIAPYNSFVLHFARILGLPQVLPLHRNARFSVQVWAEVSSPYFLTDVFRDFTQFFYMN
jgi:hypothetical protein